MKQPHRWLYAIIAVSLLLKIPVLFRPLTGYFASYQAVNAMMAEMMLQFGWEMIAAPRTFLISGDAPSLHLLYYPFGALSAAVLKVIGGGSLVFWGRFQALAYSTAALLLFMKLIQDLAEEKGKGTAATVMAVFFFALAPMNLLMGIAFQNEAFSLCLLLASFCLLSKKNSRRRIVLSALLFSLAVTARIHFCLVGPAFLCLLKADKRSLRNMLLFTTAALMPVAAWYSWVWVLEQRYPDQIQTSFFSQMGEGRVLTTSLFLTAAFWVSLVKIFSGFFATPLIPLCVFFAWFKRKLIKPFWSIWLLSSLAVILVLPRKVIDHPFYLLAALPPACYFAAQGFSFLAARYAGVRSRLFRWGFTIVYGLLILRLYLPPAFSNENSPNIERIGAAVHARTGEGDRVIAQRGASPELLYYTGRLGWPFDLDMEKHPVGHEPRHQSAKKRGYGDPVLWLENLRGQGASYLVISEPSIYQTKDGFKEYVSAHFRAIPTEFSDFLFYDLEPERLTLA